MQNNTASLKAHFKATNSRIGNRPWNSNDENNPISSAIRQLHRATTHPTAMKYSWIASNEVKSPYFLQFFSFGHPWTCLVTKRRIYKPLIFIGSGHLGHLGHRFSLKRLKTYCVMVSQSGREPAKCVRMLTPRLPEI